jgi:phosphonate transport system substrate-binding protein
MSDEEVPLQPVPGPARKSSFDLPKVLLLALVLVGIAGLVYAVIYFRNQSSGSGTAASPLQLELEKQAAYTRMAGYQDADGDLVADPPADAKDRLDPPELTFAVPPGEDQEEAAKVWQPFIELLAKKTGRPVRLLLDEKTTSPTAAAAAVPGADGSGGLGRTLEAQLDLLKTGKLHVAAFRGGQVPRAVNTAGFVPLFVPAGPTGPVTVETVVIVPTESTAKSVPELKTKIFALVSFSSATGGRAPLVLFKEQFGMLPKRDFDFYESGSHRESILSVSQSRVTAACVGSDVLEVLADEKDGVPADKYRVVFRSGKFPPTCFGVPHTLDPKLRGAIESAFKEFAISGTSVGTKHKTWARFAPVNYRADWQGVRDIDEKLTKLLE